MPPGRAKVAAPWNPLLSSTVPPPEPVKVPVTSMPWSLSVAPGAALGTPPSGQSADDQDAGLRGNRAALVVDRILRRNRRCAGAAGLCEPAGKCIDDRRAAGGGVLDVGVVGDVEGRPIVGRATATGHDGKAGGLVDDAVVVERALQMPAAGDGQRDVVGVGAGNRAPCPLQQAAGQVEGGRAVEDPVAPTAPPLHPSPCRCRPDRPQ